MLRLLCILLALGLAAVVATPHGFAQHEASMHWLDDYRAAVQQAKAQGRMLLIFFHDGDAQRGFQRRVLEAPELQQQLADYSLAKLPLEATTRGAGKMMTLLDHPSLAEMHHRAGIAIIDYRNPADPTYGKVVSQFPFRGLLGMTRRHMQVVLDLPAGSLTQRTLIYAVRTHPDGPRSTEGQFDPILADEARRHAAYQARLQEQGHQHWDTRFARITRKIPDAMEAKEVCAESWPGETLVEAAEECVNSWRQSSGHWGAVRERHGLFGYDLKRGSNGIWYGTGIFANRR